MARKVSNVTNDVDSYALLSQTPKNYDKDNYFLKELQDKWDADWNYRFNRVDVEFEQTWGHNDYKTIEVVQQPIKSDKSTDYTDDYRRLVFKNIREKRFNIGNKFRFMADNSISDFVITNPDGYDKADPRDTWLVTNFSSIKASTSVIVTRCNGVLGSIWEDSRGVAHRHYEPLIASDDLTGASFNYNKTVVSPQSAFVGVVQHNDFTRNYFVNQRFIIGYDTVYRIKAINKFYGKNTNNPENVGLMKIYFEITEAAAEDNFETGIAYQLQEHQFIEKVENDNYRIDIVPADGVIPTDLGSDSWTFKPVVYNGDKVASDINVTVEFNLLDLNHEVDITKPIANFVAITNEADGGYTLSRKRIYNGGSLQVVCTAKAGEQNIETTFDLMLMGF